jgi:hypothetical protein
MFRHSETRAVLREIRQERGPRTPLIESSITKDGNPLGLRDDVVEGGRLLSVDAMKIIGKSVKKGLIDSGETRRTGGPPDDKPENWTITRMLSSILITELEEVPSSYTLN